MPCNTCGGYVPPYQTTCNSCYEPCDPCNSCPIQLDFACLFYHKEGKTVSNLDGLNMPNGTSLEIIIELLDEKIKQLDLATFTLPYLKNNYVVNTLKGFVEAVDVELKTIKDQMTNDSGKPSGYLGSLTLDPVEPQNGNYWFNIQQGKLKIRVNNTTKEIVTA